MRVLSLSGSRRLRGVTVAAVIFCALSTVRQSGAQQAAPVRPSPLITQPVNESQLTVLKGNTHPLARPEFDLGTAPATLPMQRMLLVLKRSAAQESTLRKLLDDQQDKSSPSYHKWLTPEQYGKQFGPTDGDLQTIAAWLQSHGFQVGTTNGRTVLEFSGSASQVQEAFHTTIHKYLVNGQQYWANPNDPQIPTALTPAVTGVASLNNFPRVAMNRLVGKFTRDKTTGKARPAAPLYTYQPGFQCSADDYCFALGPYDFATIYNVLPLWNNNINGTGQTIAIVGESNINPQDVADFRSLFDLPPNSTATGNPLNIILNGPDPGLQSDESEADIDVQWSGAVAPYATIDFVVSQSTETTAGIDLSAVYIIDNNLAPVMSESYGYCELGLGTTGNQFYNTLWQQAAAQGITVFISAGDNGSAGCDSFNVQSPAPAEYGLSVSGFASTPYNVAVGGTDFNEFTNPEVYWSTTNNPTTQASALGYIPETTWNGSCTNSIFITYGYGSTTEAVCNSPQVTPYWVVPLGGSGGVSSCTTSNGLEPGSCSGGYVKPSWQAGAGVPTDGKRDLPDVSLFASSGFAGSFYIICQSDQTGGACNLGNQEFLGYGGTSVSSPAFAGIMALVNQQTGSPQGNANYVFYKLAAKDTLSNCNATANPASSCIFNDITMGTNAMPCFEGSPNCTTTADEYGVMTGYNAGTGYDLATGLGSVNANNLVTQWNSVTSLPSTTTLNSLTPTTVTHGQPVSFSVTVKPQSGTGTPTGEISLLGPSTGNNEGIGAFTLSSGTFSGTTDLLPGGTYSVTAHYPGDGTYAASDSGPISVTVSKENSQPQVFLVTFDSNGNLLNGDTTAAAYGSPYVLRVNVENSAGVVCTAVSAATATGCPSGTVAMTDNGTTLDAGTYTLNSYGYFEDLIVQLPGGTDSVKAAYAGDNSFNASSATQAIAITPASTSISNSSVNYSSVGSPFSANVSVATQSSGAAPTGTITFSANGVAIPGSISYSGTAGYSSNSAVLNGYFISTGSPFPTPGTYLITASYSGDGNYGPSTTTVATAQLQYQAPDVFLTPTITVAAGSSVTVTAAVDTELKNVPVPTGSVTFSEYSPVGTASISGTETYTTTTDAQGNVVLQATITFTPLIDEVLGATYGGDQNYPAQGSGNGTQITVTGSGFSIYPQPPTLTLVPGQAGEMNLIVAGQSNYAGAINFSPSSCSGLPALTTCSFNPSSMTGGGQTTLLITTTAPSTVANSTIVSRQFWFQAAGLLLLGGIFMLGSPSPRRRRGILLATSLLLLATLALACGGSGSGTGGGGGGGSPGTPTGNYTVTVTATSISGSTTLTSTATIQLAVQ
jgi:hypothetical protein